MEYKEIIDDEIITYNVTYDKNKLETLALNISFKCGKITSKDIIDKKVTLNGLCFNLKMVKINNEKDIYRITYDEIEEPLLSKLIRSFINEGDTKLLEFLKNPIQEEIISVDEEIELLSLKLRKLLSTSNFKVEDVNLLNNKIYDLYKVKEKNKNRFNPLDYVDDVKKEINYEVINIEKIKVK